MKGSWLHGLLFYSCLQSISDNRKGSIQRGCLQLERNKGLKSFLEGLRDEATSTRPWLLLFFCLSFPRERLASSSILGSFADSPSTLTSTGPKERSPNGVDQEVSASSFELLQTFSIQTTLIWSRLDLLLSLVLTLLCLPSLIRNRKKKVFFSLIDRSSRASSFFHTDIHQALLWEDHRGWLAFIA